LHLVNQKVVDFYSRKQPVFQTAMYGSEYMVARAATEQIIELQTILQYLGVPIKSTSYLFGDNKTVVDRSINPASKLSKRHILLSYHRVREAIAAHLLNFLFIPGSINMAGDIKLFGPCSRHSYSGRAIPCRLNEPTSTESSRTTGSRKMYGLLGVEKCMDYWE